MKAQLFLKISITTILFFQLSCSQNSNLKNIDVKDLKIRKGFIVNAILKRDDDFFIKGEDFIRDNEVIFKVDQNKYNLLHIYESCSEEHSISFISIMLNTPKNIFFYGEVKNYQNHDNDYNFQGEIKENDKITFNKNQNEIYDFFAASNHLFKIIVDSIKQNRMFVSKDDGTQWQELEFFRQFLGLTPNTFYFINNTIYGVVYKDGFKESNRCLFIYSMKTKQLKTMNLKSFGGDFIKILSIKNKHYILFNDHSKLTIRDLDNLGKIKYIVNADLDSVEFISDCFIINNKIVVITSKTGIFGNSRIIKSSIDYGESWETDFSCSSSTSFIQSGSSLIGIADSKKLVKLSY